MKVSPPKTPKDSIAMELVGASSIHVVANSYWDTIGYVQRADILQKARHYKASNGVSQKST